jgi:hypothetical protein
LRRIIEEKITMDYDAGMPIKIEATTAFDLTWKVTRLMDGKATITQTVERLRLDAGGPTGKASYDSKAAQPPDDPASKQMAETLQVLSGAEMTLMVSPDGRIESLKYSQKLAAAIARQPPQAAAAMAALSEDSLRRIVGQCLPVLPAREPARGMPWTSRLEAKFAGTVDFILDNKYTYEGTVQRKEQTVAKILNKPTIRVAADPSFGTITIGNQEVSSTSYFNPTTGRLVASEYLQKLELKITEKDKTVTIKGDTRTTMTLVDKE